MLLIVHPVSGLAIFQLKLGFPVAYMLLLFGIILVGPQAIESIWKRDIGRVYSSTLELIL